VEGIGYVRLVRRRQHGWRLDLLELHVLYSAQLTRAC
jgi:hypothetical protein